MTPPEVVSAEWYQRHEPQPWSTLRLKNYRQRFRELNLKVNTMAATVWVLMLAGYFLLIFGEMDLYRRISAAHAAFKALNGLSDDDGSMAYASALAATLGKNASAAAFEALGFGHEEAEGLAADAVAEAAARAAAGVNATEGGSGLKALVYAGTGWNEEYRGLLEFRASAAILLLSLVPFGVQVSSLIAENASVPLLVMDTMKYNGKHLSVSCGDRGEGPLPAPRQVAGAPRARVATSVQSPRCHGGA